MGPSERAAAVQVTGRETVDGKRQLQKQQFLSMRTRDSTDWAGTKGVCVAAKGTGMGHCLSTTQERKSCENAAPSANHLQRGLWVTSLSSLLQFHPQGHIRPGPLLSCTPKSKLH